MRITDGPSDIAASSRVIICHNNALPVNRLARPHKLQFTLCCPLSNARIGNVTMPHCRTMVNGPLLRSKLFKLDSPRAVLNLFEARLLMLIAGRIIYWRSRLGNSIGRPMAITKSANMPKLDRYGRTY